MKMKVTTEDLMHGALVSRAKFQLLVTLLGPAPQVFQATRDLYVELNHIRFTLDFTKEALLQIVAPLAQEARRQESEHTLFDLSYYENILTELIERFLSVYKPFTDFQSALPTSTQLMANLATNLPSGPSYYPADSYHTFADIKASPGLFFKLSPAELVELRVHNIRTLLLEQKDFLLAQLSDTKTQADAIEVLETYVKELQTTIEQQGKREAALVGKIDKVTVDTKDAYMTERRTWWDTASWAEREAAGFSYNSNFEKLLQTNFPLTTPVYGDTLLWETALRRGACDEAFEYLLAGGASVGEAQIVSERGEKHQGHTIAEYAQKDIVRTDAMIKAVERHKQKELDNPLDPNVKGLATFIPAPKPVIVEQIAPSFFAQLLFNVFIRPAYVVINFLSSVFNAISKQAAPPSYEKAIAPETLPSYTAQPALVTPVVAPPPQLSLPAPSVK